MRAMVKDHLNRHIKEVNEFLKAKLRLRKFTGKFIFILTNFIKMCGYVNHLRIRSLIGRFISCH